MRRAFVFNRSVLRRTLFSGGSGGGNRIVGTSTKRVVQSGDEQLLHDDINTNSRIEAQSEFVNDVKKDQQSESTHQLFDRSKVLRMVDNVENSIMSLKSLIPFCKNVKQQNGFFKTNKGDLILYMYGEAKIDDVHVTDYKKWRSEQNQNHFKIRNYVIAGSMCAGGIYMLVSTLKSKDEVEKVYLIPNILKGCLLGGVLSGK